MNAVNPGWQERRKCYGTFLALPDYPRGSTRPTRLPAPKLRQVTSGAAAAEAYAPVLNKHARRGRLGGAIPNSDAEGYYFDGSSHKAVTPR